MQATDNNYGNAGSQKGTIEAGSTAWGNTGSVYLYACLCQDLHPSLEDLTNPITGILVNSFRPQHPKTRDDLRQLAFEFVKQAEERCENEETTSYSNKFGPKSNLQDTDGQEIFDKVPKPRDAGDDKNKAQNHGSGRVQRGSLAEHLPLRVRRKIQIQFQKIQHQLTKDEEKDMKLIWQCITDRKNFIQRDLVKSREVDRKTFNEFVTALEKFDWFDPQWYIKLYTLLITGLKRNQNRSIEQEELLKHYKEMISQLENIPDGQLKESFKLFYRHINEVENVSSTLNDWTIESVLDCIVTEYMVKDSNQQGEGPTQSEDERKSGPGPSLADKRPGNPVSNDLQPPLTTRPKTPRNESRPNAVVASADDQPVPGHDYTRNDVQQDVHYSSVQIIAIIFMCQLLKKYKHKYPALYNQIVEIRNEICHPNLECTDEEFEDMLSIFCDIFSNPCQGEEKEEESFTREKGKRERRNEKKIKKLKKALRECWAKLKKKKRNPKIKPNVQYIK